MRRRIDAVLSDVTGDVTMTLRVPRAAYKQVEGDSKIILDIDGIQYKATFEGAYAN